MCVGFVLLAHGTALNIFLHEPCKAQPLELGGDKLTDLEITRVTGSLMVMAANKDRVAEGVL